MKTENITMFDLNKNNRKKFGMVFLAAGGNIQEWINGITSILIEENISKVKTVNKLWKESYILTTTGGRTDLVLFPKNDTLVIEKLVMWRLRFGDCSWWDDYIKNYSNQH